MSQLGVKLKTITDPELGSNLVYAAATNKQTNTISWLSECGGVDVNGVDLMGRSALHIAAENNDLAVRAYNSSPSTLQSDAFPKRNALLSKILQLFTQLQRRSNS